MNSKHDKLIWNAVPTLFDVPNKPVLVTPRRRLVLKHAPKLNVSAKCSKSQVLTDMSTPSRVSQAAHPSYDLSSGQSSSSSLQGSDGKTPMQPRPPVKPLAPYMRYTRKVTRSVWNSVHAKNQNLKFWEIGTIIGQMWKELSDEEKQQYTDEYESEKIQYAEALKVYRDSPAYQSWITAKEMVDLDVKPAVAKRSKVPRPPVESRVIVIQPIEEEEGAPPSPVEQRLIVIQPREEEDLDDGLSAKHIAASGYQYNHNLNEIFSEAVVPDVRTIINETRMTVVKKEKLLPEDESTVCFDVTLYGCGFCDEMFHIKKEFMEHCECHYCENRQTDTLLDLFEICLSV